MAEADIKIQEAKMDANRKETIEVKKQVDLLQPEMTKADDDAKRFDSEVAELNQSIDKQTDKIFTAFCKSLNIANIREYEEKILRGAQERAQKRTDFRKQIDALRTQQDYETARSAARPAEKFRKAIVDLEVVIKVHFMYIFI